MFALAENSNSCLASVCLYRDKSCTEFTDSELQILKFIAPHLKRAFKLHLQFSELRAHSTSMETALDMAPTGVILVGPKREIVLMNRSARVVTAEHDGLLATRFGLQAERPMESAALSRAIQQAARTSEGKGFSAGSTVLVSRRTRPPLEIKVSPVHGSDASPFQKAVVIVFVKDPQKRERAVEGSLRVLHRLSPAECRVALLLGDGHAPRQIANIVGVTDNTVRSQIKSIYSKTGVRRQGELIRLLLGNISPAI
jgi:DNA-binding CsgD family transcriptional regulator